MQSPTFLKELCRCDVTNGRFNNLELKVSNGKTVRYSEKGGAYKARSPTACEVQTVGFVIVRSAD